MPIVVVFSLIKEEMMSKASVPAKTRWTITDLSQNWWSKDEPESPTTYYNWTLSDTNGCPYSSAIKYEDVKVLMRAFKVDKPSLLVDKTFKSTRADASAALNLFLTETRHREMHGTKYVPPDADKLIDRAAAALARLQIPDFSDVDHETVYKAFAPAFNIFELKKKWIEAFKARLAFYGGGCTRIESAPEQAFRERILGPAAYFYLINGKTKRRITFGPYSNPFSFDST